MTFFGLAWLVGLARPWTGKSGVQGDSARWGHEERWWPPPETCFLTNDNQDDNQANAERCKRLERYAMPRHVWAAEARAPHHATPCAVPYCVCANTGDIRSNGPRPLLGWWGAWNVIF